jgi:hypothetical protein
VERERSVRACGVGRRATGGRCIGAAAAHIRVSLVSAQVGRVISAPVSRRVVKGAARLIGGDWAGRANHREYIGSGRSWARVGAPQRA